MHAASPYSKQYQEILLRRCQTEAAYLQGYKELLTEINFCRDINEYVEQTTKGSTINDRGPEKIPERNLLFPCGSLFNFLFPWGGLFEFFFLVDAF